jgi:hypothetical protein
MKLAAILLTATLSSAAGLAHGASQEKAASAAKTQEEVIVEAQRLELKRRVYEFVTGVTERGYMVESLARWNKPICPMVAGIPSAQGEFILRHLSKAVRAAGAPLGDSKCKPNFHVVLTYDPDELMQLWRKRAPRLFGMASPTAVRRIMGKARPVRVWHNAWEACAEGQQGGPLNAGDDTVGGWHFMSDCHIKDTRLAFNYVKPIQSVIVIVDLDDIKDIRIGPLSDYISMVGLAEVDLDANVGDAPTVLRLFTADPKPEHMSDWDRAFLKGLYSTSQTSRFQRSRIADEMVRSFAPR